MHSSHQLDSRFQRQVYIELVQAETISPPLQSTLVRLPNRQEFVQGGGLLALGVVAAILGVWFLRSFLVVANPNEVVILSGRKWRNEDGQDIGFRILQRFSDE